MFALFGGVAAITGAYLVFFVTLERASLSFKRLEPKLASIYDPYFWFHERHWKLSDSPITSLFAGTPFRPMMLRAMKAFGSKSAWMAENRTPLNKIASQGIRISAVV